MFGGDFICHPHVQLPPLELIVPRMKCFFIIAISFVISQLTRLNRGEGTTTLVVVVGFFWFDCFFYTYTKGRKIGVFIFCCLGLYI